jgi:YD repeat-containing protein
VPAGGTLDTQSTASTDTAATTDSTQATQQVTQQTATAPNIQAYCFTYDADNRVDVDGGALVSGQIQVVARTGSVEHDCNQAGEVVAELSNGGVDYGTQTQTFSYDARGDQTGSVLTGGQVGPKQYDADGRLTADVYTYAPGTTVTVTNADGTFHMGIGGWLSMATTYYYNADGAVYATFDYGRPNVNWNLIWNKVDQGTLDPSM